jgi:hypothetical protein
LQDVNDNQQAKEHQPTSSDSHEVNEEVEVGEPEPIGNLQWGDSAVEASQGWKELEEKARQQAAARKAAVHQ